VRRAARQQRARRSSALHCGQAPDRAAGAERAHGRSRARAPPRRRRADAPLMAHAMASAMPVLPLVASMIVSPGRIWPRCSAMLSMCSAGRSLAEPAGLCPSAARGGGRGRRARSVTCGCSKKRFEAGGAAAAAGGAPAGARGAQHSAARRSGGARRARARRTELGQDLVAGHQAGQVAQLHQRRVAYERLHGRQRRARPGPRSQPLRRDPRLHERRCIGPPGRRRPRCA
jgi:hypothetical protein